MLNSSKKAAFVFCRHYVGAKVSAMPFSFNVLIMLDEAGWDVDVFLAEHPHDDYITGFSDRIKFNFIPELLNKPKKYFRKSFLSDRVSLILGNRKFASLPQKNYDLVFGMGQAGLHFASIISKKNKGKLVLLNDEFPEVYPDSIWKKKELQASAVTDVSIVPDEIRFKFLCEDLPLLKDKPHFELINIPFPTKDIPKIDWHAKLGVSKDKNLFVHAGGVGDHNMTPELLKSVKNWGENNILVLRIHSKGWGGGYLKKVMPEGIENNIIVYDDFLTLPELDSLIQYCKASFALYRPDNNNVSYVGKASGKLMRSLALGTPVICSVLPSFDFVDKEQIGFTIDKDYTAISSILNKIISQEKTLRENCQRYYQKELDFRSQWNSFYNSTVV